MTSFFLAVTHLGDWHVVASFYLITSGYYLLTNRPKVAWVLSALVASFLSILIIKLAVGRGRPDLEQLVRVYQQDASFPSAHAAMSLAFYGFLAYLALKSSANQAWRAAVVLVTAVAVAAVGVSRVYLGVHWVSDVVAGWVLGAIILATFVAASQKKLRGILVKR